MTKLSRRSHLVSRIVLRSLLNHTWKDALNQVNQVYLLTIQGLLLKIALLFKYLCREFRVRAPSSRSKVAREASRYFSCCLRESKFIPTCTHHPISKRCCCFFQAQLLMTKLMALLQFDHFTLIYAYLMDGFVISKQIGLFYSNHFKDLFCLLKNFTHFYW